MLRNLDIISSTQVSTAVGNLLKTHEIQTLWKHHPVFSRIQQQLNRGHLALYDVETSRQRYHLTSHARAIGRREYNNPWIQDLYYIHEVVHTVHFEYLRERYTWDIASTLSENELYASLFSEGLVYFMDPCLREKTFSPLWVNNFMCDDAMGNVQLNCQPQEETAVQKWLVQEHHFDLLAWPTASLQAMIQRRRDLRQHGMPDLPGEDTIVSYNAKREQWITRWETQNENLAECYRSARKTEPAFRDFIISNTSKDNIYLPI